MPLSGGDLKDALKVLRGEEADLELEYEVVVGAARAEAEPMPAKGCTAVNDKKRVEGCRGGRSGDGVSIGEEGCCDVGGRMGGGDAVRIATAVSTSPSAACSAARALHCCT